MVMRGLTALVAGALLGCGPKVRLTVLHAADVQVPTEIQRLGAHPADSEDTSAALAGFREQLRGSPRFVWVDVPDQADALVTVRAVDAVSDLDEDEEASGHWTATRTARIGVAWELRARDGRVLDALEDVAVVDRWTGAAETRAEASTTVIGGEEAEASLFWSAGAAYARRISPLEQRVVRNLAVRGDPRLRRGFYASRVGDWDQAVRLWAEVAGSSLSVSSGGPTPGISSGGPTHGVFGGGPHPRAAIRARADHDLAVAFEIRGEERLALEHADRSLAARATERTARYRDALARSVAEARALRWVAARQDAEDR